MLRRPICLLSKLGNEDPKFTSTESEPHFLFYNKDEDDDLIKPNLPNRDERCRSSHNSRENSPEDGNHEDVSTSCKGENRYNSKDESRFPSNENNDTKHIFRSAERSEQEPSSHDNVTSTERSNSYILEYLLRIDGNVLSSYPWLQQNRQEVEKQPNIAAYLKNRPPT
jgi:hypothetical protein